MKKAVHLLILFMFLTIGCSKSVTKPQDVSIEATLQINENPRLDYKDYMIEIIIEKGEGNNMIYPYKKGLYGMSFDEEDEGYFVPWNIGVNGSDIPLIEEALKEENIMPDEETDHDFIGFFTPKEAGEYKLRVYFNSSEDFNPNDPIYLVYIHEDNGNEWTKVFPIKSIINY